MFLVLLQYGDALRCLVLLSPDQEIANRPVPVAVPMHMAAVVIADVPVVAGTCPTLSATVANPGSCMVYAQHSQVVGLCKVTYAMVIEVTVGRVAAPTTVAGRSPLYLESVENLDGLVVHAQRTLAVAPGVMGIGATLATEATPATELTSVTGATAATLVNAAGSCPT